MTASLFFVLLASMTPVLTSSSGLSAEQISRLEKNEIIVKSYKPPDGQGVAASMMALVHAPVDALIPVVHDCEHFDEFLPRTKKSEERSRRGNHRVCYVEIDMPFPLSNLWSLSDVYGERKENGVFIRRWTTKEGSFEKNLGFWILIPWGDNRQSTLLIYQVETQPKTVIPNFLISHGQTSSLPKLMKAVRKRVAR